MGDVHPFGNPHFWLDPENGRIIARAIAARLTQLDPPGAAEYKANLAAFEAKLTEGEKRWEAALAPYAGTEVVTYHNSWPNFLKRFKLVAAGYVEPKPGIPPSPSHTVELIDLMRAKKIPVILMEPYFDRKTPAQIAEKTGATLARLHPVGRRRAGGEGLLRPLRLRRQAARRRARGQEGSRAVTVLRDPAPRLRREPHPDRDPRLPRRPRRRARRHLRGPFARPDRGARHDRRPTSPATTCTRTWRYVFSLAFTLRRRRHLRVLRASHRKTRIPQEAIIGIVYAVVGGRRDPRDVQGHPGDRAPQGDARRQHPLGLVDGARQDGRPLRARRRSSTSSSGSGSS